MKKIRDKSYFISSSIRKGNKKVKEKIKKKRANKRKSRVVEKKYDRNINQRINIECKVPINFSILNNTEEVLKFFNKIIENIKKFERRRGTFFMILINMEDVQYIGSDALMYLLTLMRNTIIRNGNVIWWRGSFPKNKDAKKILVESGFTKYVRTNSENICYSTENLQIRYGKEHDPDIIAEICDIAIKKAKVKRKNILFIKEVINELMDNTMFHAYDDIEKPFFDKSWYIFVKCYEEKMSFTFLDNGLGIPYTIHKALYEKIKDTIGVKSDDYYIKSAINGEFRTRTGKTNRGKGLPEIYSKVREGKIKKFSIISNRGIFKCEETYEIKEHLLGTLVYFEVQFDTLKGDKT